jgi:hypothetical protein
MDFILNSPRGFTIAAFAFASDAAEYVIEGPHREETHFVDVCNDGGLLIARMIPDLGEDVSSFQRRLLKARESGNR